MFSNGVSAGDYELLIGVVVITRRAAGKVSEMSKNSGKMNTRTYTRGSFQRVYDGGGDGDVDDDEEIKFNGAAFFYSIPLASICSGSEKKKKFPHVFVLL